MTIGKREFALLAAQRTGIARVDTAAASLAALSLAWAALPVALWSSKALLSLTAVPMQLDSGLLAAQPLLLRLLTA